MPMYIIIYSIPAHPVSEEFTYIITMKDIHYTYSCYILEGSAMIGGE